MPKTVAVLFTLCFGSTVALLTPEDQKEWKHVESILQKIQNDLDLKDLPRVVQPPFAWQTIQVKFASKIMDVEAHGTHNGANVYQWYFTGAPNQQFEFRPTESFFWHYIWSRHSNKVVQVANASLLDGGNLEIWDLEDGAPNKQWMLVDIGDTNGFLMIVARHSDKVFDSSSSVDGANWYQFHNHGRDNQRFRMINTKRNGSAIEDEWLRLKNGTPEEKMRFCHEHDGTKGEGDSRSSLIRERLDFIWNIAYGLEPAWSHLYPNRVTQAEAYNIIYAISIADEPGFHWQHDREHIYVEIWHYAGRPSTAFHASFYDDWHITVSREGYQSRHLYTRGNNGGALYPFVVTFINILGVCITKYINN